MSLNPEEHPQVGPLSVLCHLVPAMVISSTWQPPLVQERTQDVLGAPSLHPPAREVCKLCV